MFIEGGMSTLGVVSPLPSAPLLASPQHLSPFELAAFSTAHVWVRPAETATAPSSTAEEGGVSTSGVVAPFPNLPLALSPQQRTPACVLAMTTHVCTFPADTFATPASESVVGACSTLATAPLPSCPFAPRPQHRSPDVVSMMTQV